MIAGGSISATQIYKPQNVIAWVFITIGAGLLTIVRYDSPTATWAALPVVISMGTGLLFAATVFPVLAPLPPSLAAHALAFLVFLRNVSSNEYHRIEEADEFELVRINPWYHDWISGLDE